ncbi:MAG: hypothetical protein AAF711_00305 [Planctomycetota bacterium]
MRLHHVAAMLFFMLPVALASGGGQVLCIGSNGQVSLESKAAAEACANVKGLSHHRHDENPEGCAAQDCTDILMTGHLFVAPQRTSDQVKLVFSPLPKTLFTLPSLTDFYSTPLTDFVRHGPPPGESALSLRSTILLV